MVQCTMSEAQVQEAFLAAPPLIAQQILDLSLKHPNWLRDVFETEVWPTGGGTILEQLVFRGALPQIERGFDKWRKLSNNTGCDPCDGPDCSYNWTNLGGNGFDRKIVELMSREMKSPSYCVTQIQTTMSFREVMAKIIENLYAQIDFFKEQNIGLNFLTGLAKKYIVDGGGPKPNPQNPYVYRPVGTTKLSALNMEIFSSFYSIMRRLPDAIPFDMQQGAPVFSAIMSPELLWRLYREDPQLRQDIRFSGQANDLITRYNFINTIGGMFFPALTLFPRRFNIVGGEPVEVLPYVNGVPAEVGSYSWLNPAYESATHEEVILHGRNPFKIFYLPTEETLGDETSFGPEPSFFNNWMWVNPPTVQDPFRRVGYFATAAKIGLSQQFSDAIFGILVERASNRLIASYNPEPDCPPDPVDCDNEVAEVGCPCPMIIAAIPHPITAGVYFITLAVPTTAEAEDTIQFGVDTGGYVTGTVESVSADGTVVEVTFSPALELDCDRFTTVFCNNTMGCSADVLTYSINCADATRLNLVLSNPIKADTAADAVTLFYGDGTSLTTAAVVSADMLTNTWVVDVGASAFCDQVGGVISICVPPATDASCPACGTGPTITQCEEPE